MGEGGKSALECVCSINFPPRSTWFFKEGTHLGISISSMHYKRREIAVMKAAGALGYFQCSSI